MGKWLEEQNKSNPKLGWCEWTGRYHCPNDQRGENPGWCVYCEKPWKEK